MDSTARPTVFVSYSHQDSDWKNRLVKHLGVLEGEGDLEVWDDQRIAAGDDWKTAIEAAMTQATVAVLLISADFLNSKFIRDKEVPKLLQRRQNDGLLVIPVIVHPCAWQAVAWLSKIQCRPKDGKELASLRKAKADKHLAALALEIRELLLAQPPSIDREELDALTGETGEQNRTRNSGGLATAQIPPEQESNEPPPGKTLEVLPGKKTSETVNGAVENVFEPPHQLVPGLSPHLEFVQADFDGKQTVLNNNIEPPEPLPPIDVSPPAEPEPASSPPGELALAQIPSAQEAKDTLLPGKIFMLRGEKIPGATSGAVEDNLGPADQLVSGLSPRLSELVDDSLDGKQVLVNKIEPPELLSPIDVPELEPGPAPFPPHSQPTGRGPRGAAHVSLRTQLETRLDESLDLFRGLGDILVVVLVVALPLSLLYLSALTIQPVAMPDEASAKAGEAMVISVLSNDWTRIGALRLSSVGEPSVGKIRQRPDGTVIYSPPLDFSGSDRFTYRVTNSWLGDSTEVRVTVQGLKAGEFRRNERDGLEYSWIPPGAFRMGCTQREGPCEESERPPYTVAFAKGFWLSTTEVTVGAFYRYRLKSVHNQIELLEFLKRNPQKPRRLELPETRVTWAEAEAFCRWVGGRLPTEAEWEYAARGGKSRRYPWGNEAPVTTTGARNGAAFSRADGPVEVGSFGRNPFQLFDMAGNVSEWCQDTWHKSYNRAPANGTAWISRVVSHRVIRGGSWKERAKFSRTASRSFAHQEERRSDLGFRCARDAPPYSAPKPPSPVDQ